MAQVSVFVRKGGSTSWRSPEKEDEHTKFPDSVLPRAKTRMALGQAPARPSSSSVLEEPNWRASRSPLMLISGTAMGVAAAKVVRRETAKNFMLELLSVSVDDDVVTVIVVK